MHSKAIKLLLFVLIVFNVCGIVSAKEPIGYTSGNDDTASTFGNSWVGQTWNSTTNGIITVIDLHISKTGSPGNLIIEVWNTDGSKPTTKNSDYGTITSASVGVSGWYRTTGSFTYSQNTIYAIVWYATGDNSNKYLTDYDGSSPKYTNGSTQDSGTGGASWTPLTGRDCLFNLTVIDATNPPTISGLVPANNTHFSHTPVFFNATFVSTNDATMNISFFVNGTLNASRTGIANNTIENFNLSFLAGTETVITWIVQACDSSGCTNSSSYNFEYDSVSPLHTIINPQNKSVFLSTFFWNSTHSDENLYGVSANLTCGGITYFYNLTTNLSTILYGVNMTINNASLVTNNSVCNFVAETCDSHTGELFSPKSTSLTKDTANIDGVKITFDKANSFKLLTSKKDRIGFEVNYTSPLLSKVYYVECEGLEAPKSNYKGHIVCSKDKKWIDFEDGTSSTAIIEMLSKTKAKITINNANNKVTLNSIGGLNCLTSDILLYKPEVKNYQVSEVLQSSVQYYYFNITKNADYVVSTNANLSWNGSVYTATKTSSSALDQYVVNITMPSVSSFNNTYSTNWSYNIVGVTNNLSSITPTVSQLVFNIVLTNCSTYSDYRAYNFTMYEDRDNTIISSILKGYLELVAPDNTKRYYNLSWGSADSHAVCFYPNIVNSSVYAQFLYGNTTLAEETYYLTNALVDNVTEYINLYLTPNSSLILFTVTDQDDDVVSGAYIHILKYDFATNSHYTTEILRTDEKGQAIGNVVLLNQWYKFIIYYENILELESEPVKLTVNTRNFRINLLDDSYYLFDKNLGIITSLTFTNSTKNFAFTFSNPTGLTSYGCLKVIRRTPYADYLIGENCTLSASATVLINIGSNTNNSLFIATGTTNSSDKFLQEVLDVSFDDGYKKWGDDGILASFFIRLTLAMVGIWSPFAGIVLVVVGDAFMIGFGLYHIGWGVLMVYLFLAGLTIYRVTRR